MNHLVFNLMLKMITFEVNNVFLSLRSTKIQRF